MGSSQIVCARIENGVYNGGEKGVWLKISIRLVNFVETAVKISLSDAIISAKEQAKFWIQTANKYRFIDQGSNLRGKEFNLTLHWHVMPKTGKMFADKLVMSGYRLPEEYRLRT